MMTIIIIMGPISMRGGGEKRLEIREGRMDRTRLRIGGGHFYDNIEC